MKFISTKILILLLISFYACGDPGVSIEEVEYEPKIVVEGFVYPNEPVQNIWIMRNFPLNTPVDSQSIFLSPQSGNVDAKINGVPLQFNSETREYYTNDLSIMHGTEYKLTVMATVEDRQLYTEIITTTPEEGFDVLNNNLGDLTYRDDDIMLNFHPSPGTGFYAFSIRAEEASLDNYIFNNPFFPNRDSSDIVDEFNTLKFQYNLLLNISGTAADTVKYEVEGFDTWFYGPYKVVVYAGDRNMKDYVLTTQFTQEFDGNFVEPRMHFDGDGVGIFGSAIRDTITFTLNPRI